MRMAPRGTPKPTPTLAESERPKDDTGTDVNVVVPELMTVFLELRAMLVELDDTNAVDVELRMDGLESPVVVELSEPDAVDFKSLEISIETCPSVRSSSGRLQQVSWPSFSQHQVPEDSGEHATIWPPPGWTRFA